MRLDPITFCALVATPVQFGGRGARALPGRLYITMSSVELSGLPVRDANMKTHSARGRLVRRHRCGTHLSRWRVDGSREMRLVGQVRLFLRVPAIVEVRERAWGWARFNGNGNGWLCSGRVWWQLVRLK